MKFLVELESTFPTTMTTEQREAVMAAELRRGLELRAAGSIDRIFRIPGRLANVAIWEVPDADALHALLTSLPAFPYMTVSRAQALATHPLEQADGDISRPPSV
jgi:muconolactone D-isomerase